MIASHHFYLFSFALGHKGGLVGILRNLYNETCFVFQKTNFQKQLAINWVEGGFQKCVLKHGLRPKTNKK